MRLEDSIGSQIFKDRFVQIEEVIEGVRRRKRLGMEEAEELYGLVMLKLVQDDYAALREFQQRSSWRTYLTVIVHRVLFDERTRRWGRWRPSSAARKLGETAVRLDRLINRDGWSAEEAIARIGIEGVDENEQELETLIAQLPRRAPRSFLPAELFLDQLRSADLAEDHLESKELARAAGSVEEALCQALDRLEESEVCLLRLRFACGWTVRRIAEAQRLPARPLYSRFGRILGRLRRGLEEAGVGWALVSTALEGELDLGESFNSELN